jgi:hypothetical protein
MHLEIAVVGIGLTGEEALELAPCRLGTEPRERRFGIGNYSSLAFGLAQLDQLEGFRDLALDPPIAADRLIEPGALAQQLLRPRRVIPQTRILGLGVQLSEAASCGLPVKDASSAAPATCLCRWRPPEFRRAWFTPSVGLDA